MEASRLRFLSRNRISLGVVSDNIKPEPQLKCIRQKEVRKEQRSKLRGNNNGRGSVDDSAGVYRSRLRLLSNIGT